jgi:endonuclease/exonuclease/phosphatase family metal-dependent hydrolase
MSGLVGNNGRLRASSLAIACVLLVTAAARAQTVDSLRVMTYNIWVGGTSLGQPLSRTVGVIQAAQADVVGIQEQAGSGPALAAALGFHYHNIGGSTSILSRYPIVQGESQGAKLQLSPTQQAYIFDVHLAPYPYQPYDIRDGLLTTEAQAIAAAQATRGSSVTALLSGMGPALASGAPVFLTGDFNEPSHLDWTQDAATAGLHFGKKVAWPASRAVRNAGLVDAFRELRPDEIADRGETWTPGSPAPQIDPGEVHDRIDFVYYTGANVVANSALVLGYDANDPNTDIGIQPYPSDHRSVVVEFDIPRCSITGDLTGDCRINTSDWMQFRTGQHANLTGLPRSQAYAKGDLTGDFRNDHADFVLFKIAFETANGTGSFTTSIILVPEPATALLAICLAISGMISRKGSKAQRRSMINHKAHKEH